MTWYKTSGVAEDYSTPVTPSIFEPKMGDRNFDITADTVMIPFAVEIEARNWGIKGMEIYATATIVIELDINEWGDEEDTRSEKSIVLDLSKLPVEKMNRGDGVYTVDSLDIVLNEQFEVNYEASQIVFING